MTILRKSTSSYQSAAKHLITIKYKTTVPDGQGGFVVAWVPRPNIWAEIAPLSGRQKFEYESINVFASHKMLISGYLKFQANTKYVADTWTVTWSGILGTDIQLHYQIDGGSWVLISASETNSGTYDWTIPVAAIGRNIIVRVMHLTDTTSYVLTDPYNVVAEGAVDGLPNEYDEIDWTVDGVTRTFEVVYVQNMQERNILCNVFCKERRS